MAFLVNSYCNSFLQVYVWDIKKNKGQGIKASLKQKVQNIALQLKKYMKFLHLIVLSGHIDH